jgi:hypothetical protein
MLCGHVNREFAKISTKSTYALLTLYTAPLPMLAQKDFVHITGCLHQRTDGRVESVTSRNMSETSEVTDMKSPFTTMLLFRFVLLSILLSPMAYIRVVRMPRLPTLLP